MIRRYLATRHSLRAEAATVLTLYALYEVARGLVVGDERVAVDHAHAVALLERRLHLLVEPNVQHAAQAAPGLIGFLGAAYLMLHFSVTAGLLLWLHQRRPAAFAAIRTTLLIASAIALVVFVAFPTAPPRLAEIGVTDTVSNRHLDLNTGLVSSLYNPFAAVPSMHFGYALVVAVALIRFGHGRLIRIAGLLYAPFVLLVIVATGNHFFFDAVAGAAVAAVAYLVARAIAAPAASSQQVHAIRVASGARRTEKLAA
jgi:hypothetical protein